MDRHRSTECLDHVGRCCGLRRLDIHCATRPAAGASRQRIESWLVPWRHSRSHSSCECLTSASRIVPRSQWLDSGGLIWRLHEFATLAHRNNNVQTHLEWADESIRAEQGGQPERRIGRILKSKFSAVAGLPCSFRQKAMGTGENYHEGHEEHEGWNLTIYPNA
jgi:hypothetical protein